MNIVWYWTLAAMLTAYAVLDGFDLGVGAVHRWITRSEHDRRVALNAIGPIWNANEVWLIAAGGMMVPTFPRLYAASFSGFYLALMLVLWLLILRGISIEFRGQIDNPLWKNLWDTGFCIASLLLTILLGVALGNVVRGFPIGQDGYFQGTFALLLNPYSLFTGMLSVAVLAWHGVNYLRLKVEGELSRRAQRWSRILAPVATVTVVAATIATFTVRPGSGSNFAAHPVLIIFPLLIVVGLVGGILSRDENHDRLAFRSSTLVIIALMGSAASTVYPNLLTSSLDPAYSLNADNAASSPSALRASFIANIVGMIGVIIYTAYVHRTFRGKVRLGDHGY